MTSNQRRPGFRLPWTSDDEAAAGAGSEAGVNGSAPADHPAADAGEASPSTEAAGTSPFGTATQQAEQGASGGPAAAPPSDAARVAPNEGTSAPTLAAASPEVPAGFMRDLVSAMRRVAEENRQASLSDLRMKSDERVGVLEAETEERARQLRIRAESDIAGVGEWARTEVARVEQEAEQRVVARRAQLDQQLAAEASRSEAEAGALRARVADYERELDAYHAQLSDLADPAAFAAAAKSMPLPPKLDASSSAAPVATPAPASPPAPPPTEARVEEPAAAERAAADQAAPDEPAAAREPAASDQSAQTASEASAAPDAAAAGEATAIDAGAHGTMATEVLVKGLGSFGAITGFRQSLASVDGIDGVSLSLGPTGEFVFRAIHAPSFDVAAAITSLEGETATIEERPEGGLRVTLDRSR